MNALIETLNLWGTRFTAFALPMLAQSAILIALLFCAEALLRHRVRATIRYALWMLVLIKLILPPTLISPTGLAYWLPQTAIPLASVGNQVSAYALPLQKNTGTATPVAAVEQNAAGARSTVSRLTLPAIMLALWLAAVAGLAIWVGRQIRNVAGILRDSTEAPDDVGAILESCRRQLGIRRAVRVRLTNYVGSPAICGLFRPVILVPASLPEELSEPELRSVLLHELAHYRRGDLWVGHAQILLQLFYWYNPLLWLANRMIRRVREQAVDEMVLVEMRDEAEDYPETLLQVAKLALARPVFSLGLLGILEPASGLRERIQYILRRPFPTTARVGMRGLVLVMAMAMVTLPMACRKKEPAANAPTIAIQDMQRVAMQGTRLTAAQAQDLEARLVKDPEDLRARIQLLGYYQMSQFRPGPGKTARQGHILWLIEHQPELNRASPVFNLNAGIDGAAFEQGKTLWLKQVKDHPGNLAIIGNAASYLLLNDRETAEDLLKQAQNLDPDNAQWAEKLGQLYSLIAMSGDTNAAAKAVSELEKAQALHPSDAIENLSNLAKMAFAAGDMQKAGTYATALLQQATDYQKAWNYGSAVHHGNLILGRIAVRDGNLDDAKKYLLESGNITGSPVLTTFGPNMALAKDILEKGDKDTVLAYFQLCGKFWTTSGGPEKLKTWTEDVEAGRTPDFGGNLYY